MPGSGVNKDNCLLFKSEGFMSIHLSGSKKVKSIAVPDGINTEISFLNQQLRECNVSIIRDVINRLKY